jgi:hypothetical protein
MEESGTAIDGGIGVALVKMEESVTETVPWTIPHPFFIQIGQNFSPQRTHDRMFLLVVRERHSRFQNARNRFKASAFSLR